MPLNRWDDRDLNSSYCRLFSFNLFIILKNDTDQKKWQGKMSIPSVSLCLSLLWLDASDALAGDIPQNCSNWLNRSRELRGMMGGGTTAQVRTVFAVCIEWVWRVYWSLGCDSHFSLSAGLIRQQLKLHWNRLVPFNPRCLSIPVNDIIVTQRLETNHFFTRSWKRLPRG